MPSPSDLDASFVIVGNRTSSPASALPSPVPVPPPITKLPQPPLPPPPKPTPSKAPQAPIKKQTEKKPRIHPSFANDSYKAGSARSYAHDWSEVSAGTLRTHGRHFIDEYGRVCLLRGVNLSGASKTPVNHDKETFPKNPEGVTFVGRPFPLDMAHEHFSRLRRWGFSFIRFLVTWEALEHAGPGVYDIEYLKYLREILSLLPRYGMVAFIDLHQDVWSRYTGGSGAPAWTVEAVGFDLSALEETGAAWLAGMRGGGHTPQDRGMWPTGYHKLAAATMATCFWAGDAFAPKLLVNNIQGQKVPIQQFLQNSYLAACERLAFAVGDLPGVLGFQMMNEPHRGYIDLQSLYEFDYNVDLHLDAIPSTFESFRLGAGHPTVVSTWGRSWPVPTRKNGSRLLNPSGKKVWREDGPTEGKCLWEMHNVWGWDVKKNDGVVLRESYFKNHPATGKKIDWYTDFYFPFLKKWTETIRKASGEDKIMFVEAIPNEFCPSIWTKEHHVPNMVYAPHWYDLHSLFLKQHKDFTVNVQGLSRGLFPLKAFYWGQRGARENYSLQIRNIVEGGYKVLGEKPVIIGETGLPFDINEGEAFRSDNWTWQARMADSVLTALERSLIGFTLWNYNPWNDDTNGDDWNGENFSWFSSRRSLPASLLYYDQNAVSLDQGGRVLRSLVRPYPAKTAGIPLKFEYEPNTGEFSYEWAVPERTEKLSSTSASAADPSASVANPPLTGHPSLTSYETEIFLPSMIAAKSKVIVHGLGPTDSYHYDDYRQTLFIATGSDVGKGGGGRVHKISVELSPPLNPVFEINDFWMDHGSKVMSAAIAVVAIGIWMVIVTVSPEFIPLPRV